MSRTLTAVPDIESADDPLWQIAAPIEEGDEALWPLPDFIHPGLTVITGQPNSGKTTLAIAEAKAVLGGGAWLGGAVNFPSEKGVLFLCEDVTSGKRVRSALAEHGGRAIVLRAVPWTGKVPLRDVVEQRNIGLVFIDSLYAIATDENDQQTASAVIAGMQAAGVPIVTIHHESKDGKGKPGGLQRYAAAYRHQVRVGSISQANGDGELALSLKISGNDMPGRRSLTVAVQRESYQAHQVAAQPASPKSARVKLSSTEKARLLGRKSSRLGLSAGLSARDYAKLILDGGEGNESPERQDELRQLWQSPNAGVGFRTVANLIATERAAFDAELAR